jgi:hypothetical protein
MTYLWCDRGSELFDHPPSASSPVRPSAFRSCVLCGVMFLSACSGDVASSPTPTSPWGFQGPGVESVEIVSPPTVAFVGQSVLLEAYVHYQGRVPELAPPRWSSSDTTVATITAGGLFYARKVGFVVISAHAGGRTGIAPITVQRPPAGGVMQ